LKLRGAGREPTAAARRPTTQATLCNFQKVPAFHGHLPSSWMDE
jgi:hypothetical protein